MSISFTRSPLSLVEDTKEICGGREHKLGPLILFGILYGFLFILIFVLIGVHCWEKRRGVDIC